MKLQGHIESVPHTLVLTVSKGCDMSDNIELILMCNRSRGSPTFSRVAALGLSKFCRIHCFTIFFIFVLADINLISYRSSPIIQIDTVSVVLQPLDLKNKLVK